ncbi:MAG: hypothetical protein BGO01_08425 [Armatimonadetes bacterium 55-13]|nr:nuclear transport factor 2 family protein [Armatimonadota bacterium]OJU62493.1 MAG: hypothetical protein BGO01_08425 [Armatimonadetes bacterium 55-13]
MKIRVLLILAISVFAGSAFGQAEDPGLRKELENFFHRFDKLMKAGNTNGIFDLLAPDYTNVDTQGHRMNRGEFKEAVRNMTAQSKNISSKVTVKHVRGNQHEAIAWCEEVFVYTIREGNGWKTMKSTSRWAESLRKTDKGWVFFYSQELPKDEPWSFKTGG